MSIATTGVEPYLSQAKKVGDSLGIPYDWVYAQWAHESDNFSSEISPYWNYGGIKKHRDSTLCSPYQSYESFDDFVTYDTKMLRAYGVSQCKTIEEYARCLKDGGYYGDTYENYVSALKAHMDGSSVERPSNAGYNGNSGSAGTGSRTSNSDPVGILKFAQFAASLAFQESFKSQFESSQEQSLHEFLSSFMSRFYHNIFYIPTLPGNQCMIVKPETLFIDVPSCNVIYPSYRETGNFQRSEKFEPTRLLMMSDPVAKLFGTNSPSDLYNIATLVYLDYADGTGDNKKSLAVKGFKSLMGETIDISKPMGILSSYEKENGIRLLRDSKGADLYLFLLSDEKLTKSAKTGKEGMVVSLKDTESQAKVAAVLERLAEYTLIRKRYEGRPGSYTTYFNPYIVPGFPMINLESTDPTSLNNYGYVTSITHQIEDVRASTIIETNVSHVEPELRPTAFPIIEEEYVANLDATYNNLLGDCVSRVSNIEEAKTKWSGCYGHATEVIKLIWRPLTTLDEHMNDICDSPALINDADGFIRMSGSFFDEAVQAPIIEYTRRVLKGEAFAESEVK